MIIQLRQKILLISLFLLLSIQHLKSYFIPIEIYVLPNLFLNINHISLHRLKLTHNSPYPLEPVMALFSNSHPVSHLITYNQCPSIYYTILCDSLKFMLPSNVALSTLLLFNWKGSQKFETSQHFILFVLFLFICCFRSLIIICY